MGGDSWRWVCVLAVGLTVAILHSAVDVAIDYSQEVDAGASPGFGWFASRSVGYFMHGAPVDVVYATSGKLFGRGLLNLILKGPKFYDPFG